MCRYDYINYKHHIKSGGCVLYSKYALLVFGDFFQLLVRTDSVHEV